MTDGRKSRLQHLGDTTERVNVAWRCWAKVGNEDVLRAGVSETQKSSN